MGINYISTGAGILPSTVGLHKEKMLRWTLFEHGKIIFFQASIFWDFISFFFWGGCNFIILGLKLTAIMSCVVAWAEQNFNPVLIMVTTGYRQPVQLFPLCLGCCYKRWWTVKRCDFGGIRIGRLKWTTCKALFQWVCLMLTLCFSYSEILKLSSSHVTHSRDIFSIFSRWELETAESWEHVN